MHLQAIQTHSFDMALPVPFGSVFDSMIEGQNVRIREPNAHAFPSLHDPLHQAPGIFIGNNMDRDAACPNCIRHGCPPTVGYQLSLADKVFPHKVRWVLEAGMLEYIPLNLLTDDACCHAAQEPPGPESTFVILNRKLWLLNASFNTSRESKLLFNKWVSAGANLMATMHKHMHAEDEHGAGRPIATKIADSFKGYFNYFKNLPDMKV